jgi:solute carrier family 36 (proton-coupled amino acid transporter)
MEEGSGSGSSTFGAVINIAKLSIGNGILALPFATSRGGLVFSPLAIALIAGWNVVSCFMMIQCKQVLAHKTFPPEISSSYSRISYCAFGHWGAIITDLSVFVTLFGVCVSYQIAFAQFLKDIPSHPLQNWSDIAQTIGYTYFSMLIVYPLACQQNIGFLAKTSFAGLSCLLVSIGVLIGYGLSTFQPELRNVSGLSLWPETITSFSTFSGVAIFCYGLCTFTFPIEESMRDRKEFPKAVIWSTILITIFYSLIGDTLAFVYAQDESGINQNILHHLPIHSTPAILVRLALAIVSPLFLGSFVLMMESMSRFVWSPSPLHLRLQLKSSTTGS